MRIKAVDHIAIICSDVSRAKNFYCNVLGCLVISRHFRPDKDSYKVDLLIPGMPVTIELFTYPKSPARLTNPEALGLRHVAFRVESARETRDELIAKGVVCEEIRDDPRTGAPFFFTRDPDGLPIEFVGEIEEKK